MLMPKRVKRRKQFRGSMRGKALRAIKSITANSALLPLNHAGSNPIRLRQPVLP